MPSEVALVGRALGLDLMEVRGEGFPGRPGSDISLPARVAGSVGGCFPALRGASNCRAGTGASRAGARAGEVTRSRSRREPS